MDECSPMFFESMRRQLLTISHDSSNRMDKHQLRWFAIEALRICEAQAEQLAGGDPEMHPIFTASLQLRLEKFSGTVA